MRIRRIDISHFRGIESCAWVLRPDQRFVSLIGPGDATKSTVLTAIERCLTDRWRVEFRDTDFFNADVTVPIVIRIAVDDLTEDLMSLDAFGSMLCGINSDGQLTHDPADAEDACVAIELRVEDDLEPQWTAVRPGDTEGRPVKSSLRSRFGVYRVDERVDAHLRWSRMSALGKLTESRHGTRSTLTAANRAAHKAVSAHVTTELADLATEIQHKMKALGSADFVELKPGLDLSLTNSQGNLALFDGSVPLMNFGLGTRRLAGAAAQQLAHAGSAILLVDEVEYGLEPHRLAHLLTTLRTPNAYAQVFITTHSPTALVHLDAQDLVTVRTTSGVTTLQLLGDPASLQGTLRSSPAAFLAKHVIVCEGKTELGIVLEALERWDRLRSSDNQAPSAALGVVAVEGRGGAAPSRAQSLCDAGYQVTLFADSDDPVTSAKYPGLSATGIQVIEWGNSFHTEAAICNDLDAPALTDLIALAVSVADDAETAQQSIHSQLQSRGAPRTTSPTDVESWIEANTTLEKAREIISRTAHEKTWFKNVEKGRRLVGFLATQPGDLLSDGPEVGISPLAQGLARMQHAVYGTRVVEKASHDESGT